MSLRGSFFGLEIGRTGLSTAQFGLDVTGHNIANTDTLGYTRQRAVQTAYDPVNTLGRFAPVPGHSLVGGGTRVQILDQIRSAYLDRRFRTEHTNYAYWETRTQRLSYIESFFDNVNEKTSINTSVAEFFRSMMIESTDPVSGAPRTLMQTAAMDLVQQLNTIYQGLIDLQIQENKAVKTKTQDINNLAAEIADLNKQIYNFEITGLIANDLRDKRNVALDNLAELIDIEYETYPDPTNPIHEMLKVKIAGMTLVDHDFTYELGTWPVTNNIPGEEPVWEVYWVEYEYVTGEPPIPIRGMPMDWGKIEGGQLKAHIDVRDGNEFKPMGTWNMWDPDKVVWMDTSEDPPVPITGGFIDALTNDSRYRGIPYYIEMINDLARVLVQEVNQVHRQGWSDNPLGSETNINFFYENPEWVTWYGPGAGGTAAEYKWDETYVTPYGTGAWREWDSTFDNGDGTFGAWGGGLFMQNEKGIYVDSLGNPLDVDPDSPTGYRRVFDISMVTAKNIDLDMKIKDSAFNIACSSTPISRAASNDPEETQRGNNENIRAIYELFGRSNLVVYRYYGYDANGDPILGDDGLPLMKRVDINSFDDYATTIRFDLGNTLKSSKQIGETARLLQLSAENQRTAIAGVSLDEEMVGMVRYQHAYNGASRVITAMDEALDRLINGTGRVGL